MTQHPRPPVGIPWPIVDKYEQPVLYSTASNQNVWHIPNLVGEYARFLCNGQMDDNIAVSSLSSFRRRREPRICKKCKDRVEVDGYPEDIKTKPSGEEKWY